MVTVRAFDQETSAALREALNAHKALVFDAQGLDDAGQQAFARHFGDITTAHPTVSAVDGAPNVLLVDSGQGRAADHWHTDVTFVLNPPQASTLRSITIPPYGGETLIASSAAAYRNLPEPLRRLADTLWPSTPTTTTTPSRRRTSTRSRPPGAPSSPRSSTARPPGGARPASDRRARAVHRRLRAADRGPVGRRVPQDPRPLQAYVTRPENVLRHRWSPNQLVLFDNRITQHYAVDNYDGLPHRLHRVTVAGDIPVGIEGKESYAVEGDASHYTPVAA